METGTMIEELEIALQLLNYEVGRWVLVGLVALAFIYVQVMRFKHKREREGGLDAAEWVIVGILLLIGYPLNMVCNATIMWIWFLEPPKTWTVSDRVDMYLTDERYHDDSWINRLRMKRARKLAVFLNKHDPGHVG